MAKHIDTVHLNLRKYKCNLCDMAFTTSGVLAKHQFTHSKTRPYNCNLCPTGYYHNDYLRKHFERVHGVFYTKADIQRMCGKRTIEEKRQRMFQ